jgi:hypothetical protein
VSFHSWVACGGQNRPARRRRLAERRPAAGQSLAAVVYYFRDSARFSRSAQAHTIPSPFCTRQGSRIAPLGVGVSLSGTPLLAEASLLGARLSGTSLSGI